MDLTAQGADFVFGKETDIYPSLEERAKHSKQLFVRSQDQLSLNSTNATGHVISAIEAYSSFGSAKLQEIFDYGVAVIVADTSEPAATLRQRRLDLGISEAALAKALKIDVSLVYDAENPEKRSPIKIIERIAQRLALDESRIGSVQGSLGDKGLAVRLREISKVKIGEKAALKLCEAAWVTQKQSSLLEMLGSKKNRLNELGFNPSYLYGSNDYPVWEHAFYLAHETRTKLKLGSHEPIRGLWRIIEQQLQLPVIQLSLPAKIAGATVAVAGGRGIAVNLIGHNENVWVRRSTLAHELGHTLWDPSDELKALRVDEYDEIEKHYDVMQNDYVEARANAFAVEFLAPQEGIKEVFLSESDPKVGLRKAMEHYGVSYTVAKFQVWNAMNRAIDFDALVVDTPTPTDDWMGSDSFAVDYFVPNTVPPSRRGTFSSLVVRAEKTGLISKDSAADLLQCEKSEYNPEFIIGLYE